MLVILVFVEEFNVLWVLMFSSPKSGSGSGLKSDFFWASGNANPCPSGWSVEYPVRTASIKNNQLTWYWCADILDVGGLMSNIHFSSVLNCGGYQAYIIGTITFSTTNRYLVNSFCSNEGDMVESNSKPITSDSTKYLCSKGKGTINHRC
ncbi:hypothetical protein ACTFIT_005692 [Dictyostelium discoideum]